MIIFSLIVLLKQSLRLPFLEVMYPIIFLFVSWFHLHQHKGKTKQPFIYKIIFNMESTESFKKKIYETDWEETETSRTPGEGYTIFLQKFIALYE